jgi:hypothetical protein
MRTGAARHLLPAALPFVLALILLAPATLGGKVLSASDIPLFSAPLPPPPAGARPENPLQFDSAYVFEPDGLKVREALRDGRLPVWAPELGAGMPLLAAQQSAPLFPLTWLGVIFPYWQAQAWIAVLKLALAALGTYLFATALGLRRGPALLGGITFGLGMYLVVWLMHPHVNAYVVLPWILLLAERLCRSGKIPDSAALAAALGVAYLGGQPESSLFVSLAAAGWFVYRLAAMRPARREVLRRGALALGAALLGGAVAAVMLVPFAEALGESTNVSRSQPALPLKTVLGLVFPEYWGRPDRTDIGITGVSNFTERTGYVGALPLILGAAGLVARRPSGPQLFFAGMVAISLVVAFDTGPAASAARDLPVLDLIQLNRIFVLAAFGLAMLAAFGLERLLDGAPAERRRMLLAAAAIAFAPALLVLAAHASALGELPDALKRVLGRDTVATANAVLLQSTLRWLLPAAAAVGLVALAARCRVAGRGLAAACLAVAAVDLLAMGWGYNPAIPLEQADPPAPAPVDVMRRVTEGGGRVVGVNGLLPNTASRWDLRDARGHEQPVVERTVSLWLTLGGISGDGSVAVDPSNTRTDELLDVFGVSGVLLPAGGGPPKSLHFGTAGVAYQGAGGIVLERTSPLPAAFVAYGWRQSGGLQESLARMAGGTVAQARDAPVIEGAGPPPAAEAPRATPAAVTSRSDTEVVVDVRARRAGQLVLLDTFYPGWHAEVDGRGRPIRAADAAFRAVEVGPGRHEVRFRYRPASVIAGGAVSLAASAVLLCGLLIPRFRRAAPPPAPSGRPRTTGPSPGSS